MKPATPEQESTKIHGDKLERTTDEAPKTKTTHQNALDQLEIPPHEAPQSDGGTKVHGDKLDPHSGKKSS